MCQSLTDVLLMAKRRILLLDASTRQALSACRALGRAGYSVGVAGYGGLDVSRYSRYAATYHRLPDPSGAAEAFRDALARLIADHEYEALVASDDATLARLASAPPPIPSSPRLGPAFDRLTDKGGLGALCADAGVYHPATVASGRIADVRGHLERARYPLVVKAERSAVATNDDVRQGKGASVVHSATAAVEAFEALRSRGLTPLAQEHIEREEKVNVAVVRGGGRSQLRFAHRSLRDVPPSGGSAAALESIDPERFPGAEALTALERVCDAAGYEGLAQAECIVSRDGRLFLIEVNPRLWASVDFAERLGLRVVERAVTGVLRLPSPPQGSYQIGRRYHHVPSEWRWYRLSGPSRKAGIELVRTTRPWDLFEPGNLLDPIPLARYAAAMLRQGAGRR